MTAAHTPGPDVVKLLEEILKEATTANDVIRLNRDGQGQGRIRVATAMHRIAKHAEAAIAKARGAQ